MPEPREEWPRPRPAAAEDPPPLEEARGRGRRMPRVAAAAGILLLLSLVAGDTRLLSGSWLGDLVGLALFVTLLLTLVYYGPRLLRRFAGVLLWRVRRRLMITYLFVGLTPILLLGLLGMVAGFGLSAEAMARVVRTPIDLVQTQAARSARALAAELEERPGSADGAGRRAWLRERARALQGALPGVRLALWCCGPEGIAGERAAAVEGPPGAAGGARGAEAPEPGDALPGWLAPHADWSGMAFLSPGGADEEETRLSLRALARGRASSGPFALLVDVPLEGALLERVREATGIALRRLDLPVEMKDGEAAEGNVVTGAGGGPALLPYLLVLRGTEWRSGEEQQRTAFLFDWSWQAALEQTLGGSSFGRAWQILIAIVAGLFLVLELAALMAAAWMTRAVTGTVHEMHRATERVRAGDFSYRARIGSRDQLGDLAEAFNDMTASVESLLVERVRRERLEREVEIAAEVQERLFPRRVPALATAEVAGECRAARGVAGDYYDYLEIGPGLVGLALGDVSGKGISASLLMSNLQASLRALAGMLSEGAGGGPGAAAAPAAGDGLVARMVAAVNAQLCRSTGANRFATLFLGLYDDRDRTLRYTSAGHGAALLVHADGSLDRLGRGGTVVGAFEEARYEEARAVIEPGALLVLYSDGLSEALDAEGNEFGEERLARRAAGSLGRPASQALRDLFDAVEAWSGSRERADDQTLVVVRSLAS